MADSSYNLLNIKNYSNIVHLAKKGSPNIDNLFIIFQIGLTYDLSTNDMESFRTIDLSFSEEDVFVNPEQFLRTNQFEKFYKILITDLTIDEAYETFKNVLEIYPSLMLRRIRNNKIIKTDFIFLEDVEIDETEKQAWKEYRSQLRNIPNNLQDHEITLDISNNLNVEWPTIPNKKLLLQNNYYFYD